MFAFAVALWPNDKNARLCQGREERLDVYVNVIESEHQTFYFGVFKRVGSHHQDHVV